jgi:hypothetical protein
LRQPEGQDIVGKLILVKAYKFSDSWKLHYITLSDYSMSMPRFL